MWSRTSFSASLVIVLTGFAVAACNPKSPPGAKDPGDAAREGSAGESEISEEEAEAMASIEEYLAEEEGGDTAGEEAGASGAVEATTAAPQGGAAARRDQLWALVKAKRPVVLACYKEAKTKDPKIGTRIAVRIVLKPDGSLKSDPEIVADRTDITSPEVAKCTVDAVKSIEYPPHPNGMETTFTYPFGF